MRRAVIDTHCLLASLNPRSPFFRLYQLFAAEAFEWVLSNEIFTEYEEVISRHYAPATARRVLDILALAPNAYFQEASYKSQLLPADPDDNKFVDVALASNADFLVSNDRHFLPLLQVPFPQVPLVGLQAFLATFG